MNKVLHGQVSIGDSLPELRMPVSATQVIAGAVASRDYSPLHHDRAYVTEQAGQRDIFLNTPHQAALFERYLSDWSGPHGRLGRMRFAMKRPVYAGDEFSMTGEVLAVATDAAGCGWLVLQLRLQVGDTVNTECEARYALPLDGDDNPWQRRGEDWQP